jgi:hypothetical protein
MTCVSSAAKYAVSRLVYPKVPKKTAVSPEDSEDSMFYARTESLGIFGESLGLIDCLLFRSDYVVLTDWNRRPARSGND